MIESSLLQCNNSLCKIESWLWADVNHSNLAHTLVLLEGVLCRIWMHFGGCQGVDCCSDRQADAQRDKQKGHRKRQADKKPGGRQTADRKRYMVKRRSLYSSLHISFSLSPRLSRTFSLAVPQPLCCKFIYYYSITYVTSISLAMWEILYCSNKTIWIRV